MKIVDYLGNPKNRRSLKLYFYISLGLVVLVEFLIPHEAGHFFWEGMVGFGALYGFISCVLIIVVSKLLGHLGLMQREDYYD